MKQKAILESGQEIEFIWDADDESMAVWTIGKLRDNIAHDVQDDEDLDDNETI